MKNANLVRVAVVQLGATANVSENLDTCCRLLDEAATHRPDLVVLPEFCNHVAWYDDRDHSYEVAVALDGPFLAAVAAKTVAGSFYLMINCTVQRPEGEVTGTNLLYSPAGKLIAQSDKQVLMGNENNFLSKATQSCEIVSLPFAEIGMYSCMDGVIFETSRGMAVRGAQLLLNSLNSFARDEGDLHIPVRAAENKVFVIAANKVGPLVPPDMLDAVARRLQISPEQLHGAGHSQIVAPDGTVLAKAPANGEAIVVADIDPSLADEKQRPDGTNLMTSRQRELYQPFLQEPVPRQKPAGSPLIRAGIFQPEKRGEVIVSSLMKSWIDDNDDFELLVLPELCHLADGRVGNVGEAVKASEEFAAAITNRLQLHGRPTVVAASIVEQGENGIAHTTVLIGAEGILLRQPQLHPGGRHPWITHLGEQINILDLPWGRLALVTGNDAIYPETFRLAVLQDVDVVAVSTEIIEPWEHLLGLRERAAENRLNLVVASPADGLILASDPDFTLWTEWKRRPFDGNINYPIVTVAEPGLTIAEIYPAASANRTISQKTNVVENRPWWLADTLT